MAGENLRQRFKSRGYEQFAIAFFSCVNNLSNIGGVVEYIIRAVGVKDCVIGNGIIEEEEITDAFEVRAHLIDGKPSLKFSNIKGRSLEGRYTTIAVPVAGGHSSNGDADDIARDQIEKTAAMIELLLGGSTCNERHHLRFLQTNSDQAQTYSNIVTVGAGDTIETQVTIGISELLERSPPLNFGKEKLHTICELISRSRGSFDRNAIFSSYWVALEIAAGGGHGRKALAQGRLKSSFLNERLKNLKDMRDDFFHNGVPVKFSIFDEQLIRVCICFAMFGNEENMESARKLVSVIQEAEATQGERRDGQ